MVVMSRTEGKDGKIQGFSLIEIREGMKIAATRVARHVDRAPGKRRIEYGLALSRLAAWFLVQSPETQRRIIQQGDAIVEDLRQQDEPHPPLDGEFAREVRGRHPDAGLERWVQAAEFADSLLKGRTSLPKAPDDGSVDAGRVILPEAPGRQVRPNADGEDPAVVAKHRAPPRKK